MKVQAKEMGYYDNKRRREGEEFDLIDVSYKDKTGKVHVIKAADQFSKNWMEQVDEEHPKPKAKEKTQDDLINSIPGYKRAGGGRQKVAKTVTPNE